MKENVIYLGGFSLFAFSSIAFILVGAMLHSPREMGIISIIIALQFVLSQSAGVGIHFSALFHESLNVDSERVPAYGFINVLFSSIAIGICFYLIFPKLAKAFNSEQIIPYNNHLFFYSILVASNKVFIAQLNARELFQQVGWIFALKGSLSLVIIGWALLSELQIINYVSLTFLIPEIISFGFFIFFVLKFIGDFRPSKILKYFKKDITYGLKSMWGVLLFESSSKVDILMLGVYTDSKQTGIYTFISLATDLFLNFTTLLRSWLNPRITKEFFKQDKLGFARFLKESFRHSYLSSGGFIIAVFILIACLIFFVPGYLKYQEGFSSLIIITIFICLSAGFFPMLQLFGQIGKPLTQSVLFAILFIANLIFNYIFIPDLGIVGAALGTGLAYITYCLIFFMHIKNHIV